MLHSHVFEVHGLRRSLGVDVERTDAIRSIADDAPIDFEIVYVAKAKHAEMYRAAKKMGGQSALARHLGVEAVGKVFRITKERIRAIEARAIRKLQLKSCIDKSFRPEVMLP